MSTTADMTVEIDAAIRANAELLRSVTAATEYLPVDLPDKTPPPAVARWRHVDGEPSGVELSLSDDETTWQYPPPRTVARVTPRRRVTDPTGRELFVGRVWFALLTARSDGVEAHMKPLFDKLQEEGIDDE